MGFAERLRTLKIIALAPLIALMLVGCPKEKSRTSSATQTAILEAADRDYDYGGERPPMDTTISDFRGKSIPNNDLPAMWIESMQLKLPNSNPQRLLQARIRSEGAYPLLGIEQGTNYVWKNMADSTHWVTPARPGALDYRIERDSLFDRPAMPNHQPGLLRVTVNSMAIVICLDDCPRAGHCGYY